jgi:hypothetical protein
LQKNGYPCLLYSGSHVCYIQWMNCMPISLLGYFFPVFANLHRPIESGFFFTSLHCPPQSTPTYPFLSTYLPTYPPPTNPFDLSPHHCLHLHSLRHRLHDVLPLDSLCDSIIRVTMLTFVNLSQHNFLWHNVITIACR